MNLARLSVCLLALGSLLVGCSNAKELRTSAQSADFIKSVVEGGEAGAWRLAGNANGDATRAWSERDAIHDLGATLRLHGTQWACELTEDSVRLRRSFGQYTTGDRVAQAHTAKALGATSAQVSATFADVLKLSISDLDKARAALCPSY